MLIALHVLPQLPGFVAGRNGGTSGGVEKVLGKGGCKETCINN